MSRGWGKWERTNDKIRFLSLSPQLQLRLLSTVGPHFVWMNKANGRAVAGRCIEEHPMRDVEIKE